MPYRGDVFRPGQYYHLYNRGVGGSTIFFNPANYKYCLQLMQRYRQRQGAAIIAYCLMPNHYHLLLRQDTNEPLSTFVRVVFNAYVQAVNRQEGRRGPLFEGRFRHVWVDRDEYLAHLCRYIHLNPVQGKLVQSPEEWPYSDYSSWISESAGESDDSSVLGQQFAVPGAYRSFVTNYVVESAPPAPINKYLLD